MVGQATIAWCIRWCRTVGIRRWISCVINGRARRWCSTAISDINRISPPVFWNDHNLRVACYLQVDCRKEIEDKSRDANEYCRDFYLTTTISKRCNAEQHRNAEAIVLENRATRISIAGRTKNCQSIFRYLITPSFSGDCFLCISVCIYEKIAKRK